MVHVAKTIRRHWSGILNWFETYISNGILEGINSLIQAAKAKARGYPLIDSERVEYEKSFGTLETPQQFLKALINDPWFAWLQPFSRMVVTIDEMLESEEPIPVEEFRALMSRARTLLEVNEETDDSRRSYFEALQREPDVILAHAAVMKVVKP
jgi:hypothetical protein